MLRKITATVAAAGLLLGLAACGSGKDKDTLVVGATSVPHAEILDYVKKNLADKAGLKLEVKEFSNYEQLNPALKDGQLDANYFQHKPYLDESNAKLGTKLVFVAGVHLEPLAVYSKKVKQLSELKQGATVAVPSDPSNEARALKLLAANQLITLKPGSEEKATPKDVASNPKGIRFKETDAAALPRQLGDVDASVINGNYALEAKLDPSKEALATESAQGNPYVNGLVTTPEKKDDEKIKKLVELLRGPEVKKFIQDEYHGSVLPA
ncbi:ABC transporter substrate-binding protein [Actinomadura logoneensis]|uniref:Lipoprotein n=1 Tax=Actinomadura logoneensis TaxID=2293572 RepID=A0A372JSN8_9ACTN|nr:MetQ/NlpA family ABC transporter substrate-binding protein [Actinomadura logoneensis]RFU42959.1 ABC transporter substrate-binding protein [Actinomadura logoneensis]